MMRGLRLVRGLTALVVPCMVLGAAPASTGASSVPPPPVIGQSVDVSPVRGMVDVTIPGQRSAPLTAPSQIPVGSVVNASGGVVELEAADTAGNSPYSGRFSQGEFKVEQSASGGGSTQIVLEGGCTKTRPASADATARTARKPKAHIHRYLSIAADGKFVIVGANGEAVEVGPASWVVNDNCNGSTSVVDRSGNVEQASRAGHVTGLAPGWSGSLYCQPRRGTVRYCEAVVSDPDTNFGHFELDLRHRRERQFTVCLLRAGRTVRCQRGSLKPDTAGAEETVLECYLNTVPRGTYQARFLVAGRQLGILLPWITDHEPVLAGPTGSSCTAFHF